MAGPPRSIDRIDAAVDHVLHSVPGEIVLGLPPGIGTPNPFVNALYRRIKADPARRLRVVSTLALEKPVGRSELEQHVLEPLVARLYPDHPDLDPLKDRRARRLPPNVEVREAGMAPGDDPGRPATGAAFVAREMELQGVNVHAQAVAARGEGATLRLSLPSPADLALDLFERHAAQRKPLLKVAVINRQLPFMANGAEIDPARYDLVVTDPAATHTLFGPPSPPLGAADYAIGLHASSWVPDGGTLQLGIGALGDAIAQALIVRDRHGEAYSRLLGSLCPDGVDGRATGRFDQGLYGCSESFGNGMLRLIEAGIVRREVFDDLALQQLVNSGRIPGVSVTPNTLRALLATGRVHAPLDAADLAFLRRFGILRPEVTLEGDRLAMCSKRCSADLRDESAFETVCRYMLGTRLSGGVFLTGGALLGPQDFYERLRTMAPQALARIDLKRIDGVEPLAHAVPGLTELQQAQRRRARFMHAAARVTVLGAAVGHALDTPAPVGALDRGDDPAALPDARWLTLLHASHDDPAGPRSSIVWNDRQPTLARKRRDIVITEYGVADLRDRSDAEVVQRLIAVADSRFQDELVREAQAHGQLPPGYAVPERYRHNLPQTLQDKLQPSMEAGLLPDFPFGTELSDDALHIVRALNTHRRAGRDPVERVRRALEGRWPDPPGPQAWLERLDAAAALSFEDLFLRRLYAGAP